MLNTLENKRSEDRIVLTHNDAKSDVDKTDVRAGRHDGRGILRAGVDAQPKRFVFMTR